MSHFNESAKQWDTPDKIVRSKYFGNAIKRHLPQLGRPLRVLDLGCGTGLLSFEFTREADFILGMDTSEGMLAVFDEKAQKFPQAHSVNLDLENQEFKSETKFDVIVSSLAFHHLTNPSSVMKKLKSVLAEEGKIAIVDLDKEDGSFHSDPVKKGVKHSGFSEQELKKWAQEAGLKYLSREIVHVIEKNEKRYPVFLCLFSN
jgi:tRNA (cmo5U34)-methyltransferase